ncbi:amidohydrolase family protein, partial [Dehalococcoidia bacterium]|nr:amidohydrolase family protein [Dehalococcoidia bacterium]
MLNLLIRGGLIVDGTGSPGFYGAVGVLGDQVRIFRGDVSEVEAAKVIDASGHIVCPGFIDVHSHGGLVILGEPLHEPKVRQGVTTELIGVDGNSAAPFKTQEELHRFIELDAGLNGYPPMPAQWSTVGQYLSKYDNKVAVNICYILGNAPVRIWSVGWNDRPATKPELEDMKAVVREAMEEGACGLSTGLDYPPGSHSDTAELIELCKVVSRMGGFYHTHTRRSLRQYGLLAPWEEALEIGWSAGAPVHLTHYRQGYQGDGSHLDYIALVENARDAGMDVTFDCYPYVYSSTRAIISIPNWAKDGGPERLKAALSSPLERDKLREEMDAAGA